MLELAECVVLAKQLKQSVAGKRIKEVVVGASSHKFAFMANGGEGYEELLGGAVFTDAQQVGGFVQLTGEKAWLLLGDGISPRYYSAEEQHPKKHQLYLLFEDNSALVCSVQMYGGMWAAKPGGYDNPYYAAAREKPSPLSKEFTPEYFVQLRNACKQTISIKAFLATEQRIPGLGNGALQDILFAAGTHPQSRIETLTDAGMALLYFSITETMAAIVKGGGRDTEKDLYGNPGGYKTVLSAKTWKNPCSQCGGKIVKKAYLGGSIYFCPVCQLL